MYRELKNNQSNFFTALEVKNPPNAQMVNMRPLFHDVLRTGQASRVEFLWKMFNRDDARRNDLLSTKCYVYNQQTGGVDLDQQGNPVSVSSGETFLETAGTTAMRGQVVPNKVGDAIAIRWEDTLADGFANGKFFFNSTRFPAVRRYTEEHGGSKVTRAFPLTYRVCYSSHAPTWGKNGLCPHEPQFMKMMLRPDPGSNVEVPVNLDRSLIGDNNCVLAIMASLENSYPVADSYIYFYPEVPEKYYDQTGSPFASTDGHKITGSSLGMAVFAAVSGWSNILYTGYIPYIVPEHRMLDSPEYRAALANKYNTPHPTYKGIGPFVDTVAKGYQVSSKHIVKVVQQLNFVDSVQDIPFKVLWAEMTGTPLVFPASTSMGDSIHQFLARSDNQAWLRDLLNIVPEFYTMSRAQNGEPALRNIGANQIAYTLYTGSTVTEFMLLSTISAQTRFQNGSDQETLTTMKNNKGEPFKQAYIDRRIQQGERMSKIFEEHRNQVKEINTKFSNDPPAWSNAMNQLRKSNKTKRVEKKNKKKAKAADKSQEKQQIRQKLQEIEEKYKEDYQAAKIALGPKPSKAAQAKFRKEWKNPASLRKKLNTAQLKAIYGQIPMMPFQSDPAVVLARKRVSRVKALSEMGISSNEIISAVNREFQNMMAPLAASTDLKQWLETNATKPFDRPTYKLDDQRYAPPSAVPATANQQQASQQQQQAPQQQQQNQMTQQQQVQQQQQLVQAYNQQGAAFGGAPVNRQKQEQNNEQMETPAPTQKRSGRGSGREKTNAPIYSAAEKSAKKSGVENPVIGYGPGGTAYIRKPFTPSQLPGMKKEVKDEYEEGDEDFGNDNGLSNDQYYNATQNEPY